MTSGELVHSMQSIAFRDCTQRLIHPSIHGSVHYDTCLFTRRLLLLEHFRKSIHGRSYLFLESFLFVLGNSFGHKTINSIRSVEGSNWDWSVKWTNRNPIPNFSRIHLWSSMKRWRGSLSIFYRLLQGFNSTMPLFPWSSGTAKWLHTVLDMDDRHASGILYVVWLARLCQNFVSTRLPKLYD